VNDLGQNAFARRTFALKLITGPAPFLAFRNRLPLVSDRRPVLHQLTLTLAKERPPKIGLMTGAASMALVIPIKYPLAQAFASAVTARLRADAGPVATFASGSSQ
jgi:hypothetical protein